MKKLQEIINNKVQELIDDNTIKNTIESGIEKAVIHAINNQFERYGKITEEIEKSLKEGLQINTDDLPFESYNQQMLVAVKSKLANVFQGQATEKFMQEIDRLLDPAPKEISIKELVEKVVEFWKTDEPWEADDLDDEATVEIEEGYYKGKSLKMWKQKESGSRYSSINSPDLELYISDSRIRISHRQAYNPTCFSEHEAFIFKLYAAGTVITGIEDFDPDECDLTLKECEY